MENGTNETAQVDEQLGKDSKGQTAEVESKTEGGEKNNTVNFEKRVQAKA